ncbi:hypothetical protein DPW26_13220, partial [Enterococcus faecium]
SSSFPPKPLHFKKIITIHFITTQKIFITKYKNKKLLFNVFSLSNQFFFKIPVNKFSKSYEQQKNSIINKNQND